MSNATLVAAVLALAVALGLWRTRGRRRLARLAAQIAAAALLYFCLFPPSTDEDFVAGELVVLTPGATAAQLAALPLAARTLALPGVAAAPAVERAPDLATALRRHADARRLRIVGGGLPPRDREAARGLVAAFDAAPLPRGLVELDAPATVPAGGLWRAAGRVADLAGGRIELADPSGAVVAAQTLDAQGRFEVGAAAKSEGAASFALRVFDHDGKRIESATVPLAVQAGTPLKILLLAGAPDADLKYLRRWAVDAGLELDSRIALSEGIALDEGTVALDAAALRRADVAIIDERAWAALDASHKQALTAAVRDGLGLLLRPTGPLPAPVAADWAALGYRLQATDAGSPLRLDRALGLADDGGLRFARQPFAAEAADAAPLLRADDGTVLAWTRDAGFGRVGVWLLADTYQLELTGARAAFGSLWGRALAAVARARGEPAPTLPAQARIDERSVLCGIADDAAIVGAAGERSALLADTNGCAAWWPEVPGWSTLENAGKHWPLYVRARDEDVTLAAGETARATQALVGAVATGETATRRLPSPRWPFFLAWLAIVALLWWLERSPQPASGIAADRVV